MELSRFGDFMKCSDCTEMNEKLHGAPGVTHCFPHADVAFVCCDFYGVRLRISFKIAALVGTVVDVETMKWRVDTGVSLHFMW